MIPLPGTVNAILVELAAVDPVFASMKLNLLGAAMLIAKQASPPLNP